MMQIVKRDRSIAALNINNTYKFDEYLFEFLNVLFTIDMMVYTIFNYVYFHLFKSHL